MALSSNHGGCKNLCDRYISRGVMRCLYETVSTLGMYDVAEEVEWQEKRICKLIFGALCELTVSTS